MKNIKTETPSFFNEEIKIVYRDFWNNNSHILHKLTFNNFESLHKWVYSFLTPQEDKGGSNRAFYERYCDGEVPSFTVTVPVYDKSHIYIEYIELPTGIILSTGANTGGQKYINEKGWLIYEKLQELPSYNFGG